MSLDGVLHVFVQDHSYTGDEFLHFIDQVLLRMNPYPGKNSVLLLDNASIHKSRELEDLVHARYATSYSSSDPSVPIPLTISSGMHLLYLPPYSPDFNPIEEAFSAMKAWIREHRGHCLDALADNADPDVADPYWMLYDAVRQSITPEKARGWFAHAGYL